MPIRTSVTVPIIKWRIPTEPIENFIFVGYHIGNVILEFAPRGAKIEVIGINILPTEHAMWIEPTRDGRSGRWTLRCHAPGSGLITNDCRKHIVATEKSVVGEIRALVGRAIFDTLKTSMFIEAISGRKVAEEKTNACVQFTLEGREEKAFLVDVSGYPFYGFGLDDSEETFDACRRYWNITAFKLIP